jgi:PAS domain-containing protein
MDETNNFEDRLRQEQRQLETIFSQASLGLCLTRNRQIMRCNPAMEAMFGFASGGLTQKKQKVKALNISFALFACGSGRRSNSF